MSQVVEKLAACGVKMIAMRCAGYDRVDLAACAQHGISVVRVPTYSPTSVAEHAAALLFAVNRCVWLTDHECLLRAVGRVVLSDGERPPASSSCVPGAGSECALFCEHTLCCCCSQPAGLPTGSCTRPTSVCRRATTR